MAYQQQRSGGTSASSSTSSSTSSSNATLAGENPALAGDDQAQASTPTLDAVARSGPSKAELAKREQLTAQTEHQLIVFGKADMLAYDERESKLGVKNDTIYTFELGVDDLARLSTASIGQFANGDRPTDRPRQDLLRVGSQEVEASGSLSFTMFAGLDKAGDMGTITVEASNNGILALWRLAKMVRGGLAAETTPSEFTGKPVPLFSKGRFHAPLRLDGMLDLGNGVSTSTGSHAGELADGHEREDWAYDDHGRDSGRVSSPSFDPEGFAESVRLKLVWAMNEILEARGETDLAGTVLRNHKTRKDDDPDNLHLTYQGAAARLEEQGALPTAPVERNAAIVSEQIAKEVRHAGSFMGYAKDPLTLDKKLADLLKLGTSGGYSTQLLNFEKALKAQMKAFDMDRYYRHQEQHGAPGLKDLLEEIAQNGDPELKERFERSAREAWAKAVEAMKLERGGFEDDAQSLRRAQAPPKKGTPTQTAPGGAVRQSNEGH